MPHKETLKLPTIDVARTRGEDRGARHWNPPVPSSSYFDQADFEPSHHSSERKRPFRISLRPKYEHGNNYDPTPTIAIGGDCLETRSLPPLLTSAHPDKSVSIRRDGRGDFLVANSLPAPPETLRRERPLTPTEPYSLSVSVRSKRKALAPIENMPLGLKPARSTSPSTSGSSRWSQSLSQGMLEYEEDLNRREMEKYINTPFKSPRLHPRGAAPPKPEQVLVPSRRHEGCLEGSEGDVSYDWEWENLYNSITLPRIEAVLRAEGIKPKSISEQIAKIKERCKRQHDYTIPPNARPKIRPKPPEQLKPLRNSQEKVSLNEVIESTNKSMSDFLGDIEQTRWLSYQHIERGQFGKEFVPPRIVLLSSNVPGCADLMDKVIRKDEDIIPICYDFEKATYESLLDELKARLHQFKEGCRARSLLLFCQGGPGYLYMLKKRVVTPQKIVKGDQTDLTRFWREIGEMMSRLQPDEAFVHVMGCDVLSNKQGNQLFKEIKKLVKPNTVHIEAPKEDTPKGRESIGHYLDLERYDNWRRGDRVVEKTSTDSTASDTDADAAIFAVSSFNAPQPSVPKSRQRKLTSNLDSIGEKDGDVEMTQTDSSSLTDTSESHKKR